MAAMRLQPEENDLIQETRAAPAAASDDERSVAADSWSVKSDYGSSALDDDQRQADADVAASFPATASDYSSDKDESDANEAEASILGFQSYWDSSYAEDLTNFQLHGHPGEVWFGEEVMDTIASWTKNLCMKTETGNVSEEMSSWSVLDLGTGNGLLLQALAKQGFSDLTGTDYSEGAIDLAKKVATRDGFTNINFLVDDVLETKLDRKFKLVMDKGTLDAIGLHPDGPVKRMMYWDSVANLVVPGGILVITSCNSTRNELVQEVENFNQKRFGIKYLNQELANETDKKEKSAFKYLDHVRTYPTFKFGGVEGSRVCTVAFCRL
ncbi:methyltransferase-like protein 10 isoform X2 [Carex littledalei]|uniref:Protein-lysine N-methyltransferase FCM35_KLT21346 n=1 Tax=Carex littledalei TaxID=544730 RepID=A0A833R5Z2_9POAL|nr:methyltransferase-like protein 10 isoform X2 [Carex littledalei]